MLAALTRKSVNLSRMMLRSSDRGAEAQRVGEAGHEGDDDVLADPQVEEKALEAAVLRHVTDARGDRIALVSAVNEFATDTHLSGGLGV